MHLKARFYCRVQICNFYNWASKNERASESRDFRGKTSNGEGVGEEGRDFKEKTSNGGGVGEEDNGGEGEGAFSWG